MSKIDEILKKIAADTSRENTLSSSNIEPTIQQHNLLGDPNCPICGGLGYVRVDVHVGHPDFGKVFPCTCRQRQINQQVRQRLYTLSNLDELSYLTFDNFQPRGRIGLSPYHADSLEVAYNQARHFAQSLKGWLLIQGGYGCGKTHLAAAIANFAASLGVPALFITVPDLLDRLRFTYDDPDTTFEERFDEIRQAPLLVMDDFGTQNATPWAQEKLFQILNYRYINRLPLVVTTNTPLGEVEERIISRLLDPELVTRVNIQAPDYRRPADDTGHPALSSLEFHADQTFGSFENRRREGLSTEEVENLEKALKDSTEYAENPEGWLVFIGDPGCGKTHLAAAIANYRAKMGQMPLFISAIDLLDHLRATFAPGSTVSYDHRFNEIKTTPLLILDGLGTHSATPWAREKLFQLIDHRYNAELPTVITMAKSIEEFEKTEPQIISRMLDQRLCRKIAIIAPKYHGQPRKKRRVSTQRRKTT
jgi:DNA replication protein DnaC